ncbi:Formate hydrogenlyase subunit 6 [Nymphon striatum]|nr:Formate hydrogenlyase subunit 6 [Nymphon striatum]
MSVSENENFMSRWSRRKKEVELESQVEALDKNDGLSGEVSGDLKMLHPDSTSVVEYSSSGHVVIIGDSSSVELFGELPANLTSEVVQYEGLSPDSDVDNDIISSINIEGALGQFVVKVADHELKADIILDLTPESILKMEVKPPGYFVVDLSEGKDSEALEPVLNELKEEIGDLVGTFEKPRYFEYNESICAHGRSGKPGCTRCIDACPTQAITSLINSIQVDPYLCQGGGICTTVCPSGAITYTYPKPKDLLTHVRTLVVTYLNSFGEAENKESTPAVSPKIVFVNEEEQERAQQMLPGALIIMVEEVASVGPEVWLSALAWGASNVQLFDLDGMPRQAYQALELHLEMVQETLLAMNYPAGAVSIVSEMNDLLATTGMPAITPATHAPLSQKRQSFYMALDYLVEQAERAKPIVLLPAGSIFGEVMVNESSCTLCMACVSSCPGNALQDGSEIPQLSLVEANCVQCDVCTNTCPENAITISPRLLLDSELRKKPRVLNEESPFCCISCGRPFATKSGITTILEKLSGHSMFADERSKNRLKMCDDCRVRDMMEDPDT